MKRVWITVLLMFLLAGCGSTQTFEPVTDVYQQQHLPQKRQITFDIPEDASSQVMDSDKEEKLYFCNNYTLCAYTVEAGNLYKTVKDTTGFPLDQIQLMQTQRGDMICYQVVWTAAGEGENMVCRACILDDGHYHYVLTAMAGEQEAGELAQGVWNEVFRSFRALTPDQIVSSGS